MSTSLPSPIDVDVVALSLLRIGFDTLAPRLFKEHLMPGVASRVVAPDLLRALCVLLDIPPGEQPVALAEARRRAAAALTAAQCAGLRFLSVLDASYPSLLKHIPDPPLGLWILGTEAVLEGPPVVAVVGSRNASPGGLLTARTLARGLADAGLVVISGLARGVDGAAHRGALDREGTTVAVLGSGLDELYPREHAALARDIAERGAVLSEHPPGTRPYPQHFPLRNRIISGLSRAVVVVEASKKSGSLITAKAALEQGRDVLAVPGPVVSGCHEGCHALIKDGARLVETVDDVLQEIGWAPMPRDLQAGPGGRKAHVASPLWAIMRAGEPVSLDQLASRTKRSASDLLVELSRLELAGDIARVAGGSFVKS